MKKDLKIWRVGIVRIVILGVMVGGCLNVGTWSESAVRIGLEAWTGAWFANQVYAVEGVGEDSSDSGGGGFSLPELFINAVNPGYTIDGQSNVGEMIELSRMNPDTPYSLAGITISYTNSSGNSSILFEFSEYSVMNGENILLRLASSPNSELAGAVYTKTLAMKGGIELKRGDTVIDSLCWNGKEGCYKDFKSGSMTSLVRNRGTGEFELVENYEAIYDANSYTVNAPPDEEGYGQAEVPSRCRGMVFSEILSYYEVSKTEQFIEFYNSSSEQIVLDGCMVRYKNRDYVLSGVVGAEGFIVYYPEGFTLTKNPTSSNELELIDADGKVIDKVVYYNGQRKGTAYAHVGYDEEGKRIWKTTYAPTPGQANNYQEYRTCEEGKVLNETTGNCVKITTIKERVCAEGQYLNILTGRCKKIETVTEKQCKEGYYLNEETGRCRKIVENTGADYTLKPEEYKEESSFVGFYAVLGVLGVGGLYLIYEFRSEIRRLWCKVCR